ncbi:MAG: glycosyltransferase, partial [Calditrichaeota bacterium]
MKILMVHKFYYIEGGAERYVFNVSDLLRQKGHTVIPFAMQDERNFPSEYSRYFADRFGPDQLFMTRNPLKRIQIARRVIYNREAQRKLDQLIKETRPDIAHVHSVYHHLSPSVLSTLKEHNLPVMMTLHDYKIICPNYILMDGSRRVCEACRGKSFWKATAKKCFRDSYAASALVSLEAYATKFNKSYSSHVDLFMSPSRFLGDRVAAYGYQPVRVQPYTLDLTEYQPGYQPENYFLFMGRLTHEKGLHFLIDAARQIRNTELYIVGTGPLANELRERISREKLDHVKMIGYKSGTE